MYWRERNLEAIKKYREGLLEFLKDKNEEEGFVKVKQTENGYINFYYKSVAIYSSINPYKQIEKIVEQVKVDLGKGVILVFGFGGGYLIERLLDYVDRNTIIITLDPDIVFLKKAIEVRDLRRIVKAPNLVIGVLNNQPKNLSSIMAPYIDLILSRGIGIIFDPVIKVYKSTFYRNLKKELIEYMRYLSIHFNTSSVLGFAFLVNTFFNLPRYVFGPGIQLLKDKLPDIPAIIVSAGPSLDKNIDLIKYTKNKALVIALGPTFKPLINRGIIPDFVVGIDPVDAQIKMFSGKEEETKDSILVTFPYFNHKALRLWKGKTLWIGGKDPLVSFIDEITDNFHDNIDTGMTVAHTAFLFADYIGANPIILMGQDLSFASKKSHVSDAPHVKDVNLNPETTIWVEGNYEEKVPTTRSFASFIYLFNAYVEKLKKEGKEIINATEGGAKIEGAKLMKFKDVLNQLILKKELSLENFKEIIPWNVKANIEKFSASVDNTVEDLQNIMEISFNLVKEIRKLKRSASIGEISNLNKNIYYAQQKIINNNAFNFIRKFVEIYERRKRTKEEKIKEIFNTTSKMNEFEIEEEISLQKKKSITYYSEIYAISKFYRDMFLYSKGKVLNFYNKKIKKIKDERIITDLK